MKRLAAWAVALLAGALPILAAELEVRSGSAAVGTFGLDITVGSTCSSADEVALQSPPATIGGDHEACQILTVADVEVATAADLVAGGAVVFADGFSVAGGATLSVTLDSLMPSRFGVVTTASPIVERTFNARFHLRLDSLSLADGEEIDHFHALAADGSDVFRMILRRQAGQNLLVLGARQDGGGEILTPAGQEVALPAGWSLVELDWRASVGDGQLLVSVNQAAFVGLVDLANDLAEVERVRWGAIDGSFSGSPGRLEVDGFSAWR